VTGFLCYEEKVCCAEPMPFGVLEHPRGGQQTASKKPVKAATYNLWRKEWIRRVRKKPRKIQIFTSFKGTKKLELYSSIFFLSIPTK
jgi:hypothetical protein